MKNSNQSTRYYEEFIKINNLITIVNKSFLKNFYIPILLLFFPLFSLIISFFTSSNVITFNQSVISILSIDLFVIGFVIIPIFFKIYQNSLVTAFSNKPFIFIRNIFFSLLIYYFFIAIISIGYTFLIIFLFGLTHVKGEVFYLGTTTKVFTYNDFIFSCDRFYSIDLGIESTYATNWPLTITSLFISFIYYFSFGLLFMLMFKKNQIYWTAITFVSLLTIIDGALLISIENIRQYFIYEIFSFFSISIYPVFLVLSFWLGGNPFNDIKNIYSSVDIDFEYPLTYQSVLIISFLIVLFIIIGFILVFYLLFAKNNIYYFYDLFDYKKKKLCNDGTYNNVHFKFSILSLFRENKRNNFDINVKRNVHSYLDVDKKDLKKIVNKLTRKYLFNSPYKKRRKTSAIFLECSINHIPEISIPTLFNILQTKMNNEQIEWVSYCFNWLKSICEQTERGGKIFDEYLLLIAYSLVANDLYIFIESFYKINNREVLKFIVYMANKLGKTIVIIGDSKKNDINSLFELK